VASRFLGSALALAWRLQRTALAVWVLAFTVIGGALGGVAQTVADLLDTSPRIRVMFTAVSGGVGIVDAYFHAILGLLGLVAAGHALQAALRLRSEEEDQRAEPVLAASVGRLRWAAGHLAFAALGPALALAAAGTAAGIVHGAPGDIPRLVVAALSQLPAIWVVLGVAVCLFGLAPRFARASWGALAACIVLGQLGRLLQLPDWAMGLSPYTHLPNLPGGDVAAAPLLALVAVAAALTSIGLVGFRRRDLG
jgi:ABC-2 type transport system permease protein